MKLGFVHGSWYFIHGWELVSEVLTLYFGKREEVWLKQAAVRKLCCALLGSSQNLWKWW